MCLRLCVVSSFNNAKYYYLGLFALTATLTWLLRDFGDHTLKWLPFEDGCVGLPYQDACVGTEAVLRLGIANVVFFGILAAHLFNIKDEDNPTAIIHTGLWIFKLMAWIGLAIGSLLLPKTVVNGFAIVLIVFATLYQIVQLIILVDFWYQLNDWLLNLNHGYLLLIFGSFCELGAALTMIIASYILYAWRSECTLNIFLITITLILGLIVVVMCIAPWKSERVGLFIGGAVFSYCSFLLISALNSQPSENNVCKKSGGLDAVWILAIGFAITMIVVLISTLNSGTQGKLFEVFEKDDGEESSLPYHPFFFHIVFMLASAYLAMLFNGWNAADAPDTLVVDRGYGSMWAKVGTQWCCYALAIWTLIAPSIFPDRDFAV